MIFSFTTKGRDCLATMTVGLSVVPSNGAERGGFDCSVLRPVAAAMPPMACVLPAWLSMTCRGWLHSAPGFFHSFQSFALKLCNQPRNLVVKFHKGFLNFQIQLLSLIHSTSRSFRNVREVFRGSDAFQH
jgi:hypothetical protein